MKLKDKITFSAFADEISPDFDKQLSVLKELGIPQIEIRGVDGKNLTEYTLPETEKIAERLQKAEIRVSAIGSPLGKIKITEEFSPHMALFRHVAAQAKILQTRYIRIFSFYVPEGKKPSDYRAETLSRLTEFLEYARQKNLVLLHENEKGIYGDNAARCLDLMENLSCPHFGCTFDFANFIQCGQNTYEAYRLLSPYIQYIHVKDALKNTGEVVPPGQGDGQIRKILVELEQKGYSGILSLEPHLADFAGFSALEQGTKNQKKADGETAFRLAFQALKKILES